MEKYKQAFEFYKTIVKSFMREGMSEIAARAHCEYLADGIIQVAIYDADITPEQFDEIQSWRDGHEE